MKCSPKPRVFMSRHDDHVSLRVDCDVLWDTIELDLPPLIEQLQKIVKE